MFGAVFIGGLQHDGTHTPLCTSVLRTKATAKSCDTVQVITATNLVSLCLILNKLRLLCIQKLLPLSIFFLQTPHSIPQPHNFKRQVETMIQEITIKPSQTPNLCAVGSNPSLFLNLSVMDFCFPGLERRT